MLNIFGYIVNIAFACLMAVIVLGIAVRVLRDRFSAVKEVGAEIVNKQSYENLRHSWQRVANTKKYVVTFQTERGKMHFDVSEFSYNGYRIGEKGTLTYQGTRLVDFK